MLAVPFALHKGPVQVVPRAGSADGLLRRRPVWLAPFQERGQALATFRTHSQSRQQPRGFLPQRVPIVGLGHAAHELLGGTQRIGTAAQDEIDLGADGRVEPRRIDSLVQ